MPTRRVPYLELAVLALDGDSGTECWEMAVSALTRTAAESTAQRSAQSRAELDADSEVVDGREAAVCELKKETGLAHA